MIELLLSTEEHSIRTVSTSNFQEFPMKRRSVFLALAAGFLVWGFGALDARAGSYVPLPTNYGA